MKKGFCYIQYTSKQEAESAVKSMNGKEVSGSALSVEVSKSRHEMQSVQHQNKQTLHLSNLPFLTKTAEIEAWLLDLGLNKEQILEVNLVTDKHTGRSKGYAYIEVNSKSTLKKALEKVKENPKIGGRHIILRDAAKRYENSNKNIDNPKQLQNKPVNKRETKVQDKNDKKKKKGGNSNDDFRNLLGF